MMTHLEGNARLRPAQKSDAEAVWRWRIATPPEFLEAGSTPTLEEHMQWFSDALLSPNRQLLSFELASGAAAGHLRLDFGPKDQAVVSVVLNPDHRGAGWSKIALLLLENCARQQGLAKLTATIHRGNLASLRGFASAGYFETATQGSFAHWERNLLPLYHES